MATENCGGATLQRMSFIDRTVAHIVAGNIPLGDDVFAGHT
jgi:hypothetical protein